jgi:hypothetical protein
MTDSALPLPAELTDDAILDLAAAHGLISPRKSEREWSASFNKNLIALVRDSVAAAAPAPPVVPKLTENGPGRLWTTEQVRNYPRAAAGALNSLIVQSERSAAAQPVSPAVAGAPVGAEMGEPTNVAVPDERAGYKERCEHGVRWENRCQSCASGRMAGNWSGALTRNRAAAEQTVVVPMPQAVLDVQAPVYAVSVNGVRQVAGPRPPCALCGVPYEKHGSYPTCSSHSYAETLPFIEGGE